MQKVTRTFDILDRLKNEFPEKAMLTGKNGKNWYSYTTTEYINKVNYLSASLLKIGINKQDKVVTICNNRPEWNILDMALAQVGAVHVPLYPNLSSEEYQFLLSHSDCRMVIFGNQPLYNRAKEAIPNTTQEIEFIYSIDPIEGIDNLQILIDRGQEIYPSLKNRIEEIKESISEDDMFTIIYTSGTTGTSKGVMVPHRAMVTNAIESSTCQPLNHNHKTISFLPLNHVYERMLNYHMQYKGLEICYARNIGTVTTDLQELHADIFSTVPRFLEKVYDAVMSKRKNLTGAKAKIFDWAIKVGEEFEYDKLNNPIYKLKLNIARKLVFSKWAAALGGNIKVVISGGAALQPRLARIFSAVGISVQEGYGLSETGPVIAVNKFEIENRMIGTVGPVLDGVSCKIAEDGEILCKGPNLMLGYYKDPQYTDEVVDKDGWFHTGDIGVLVDNKFLKITDRKKSIFKLSSGKYIAPQVIENRLKESPYIEQLMIVGEQEKFVAAVVSPNLDQLADWAKNNHIQFEEKEALVLHPDVIKMINKEISSFNKRMSPHEHIKKSFITADQWSSETNELSATLKLKRDIIAEKYKIVIAKMFG
ncbi:long-chain fatty acid--CoA ligase [Halosquirtibacter laminarini]|uniref:Long-chain fatty acid--CoA ligase n=1 Tax=Halosquirtibacter laminarini TaxID=3374600 RepID=A0AC61NG07_9BACT|nr:long-chain fatty acid--CoA ligase [Prolixibacteraceae bacterium]